MKTKLLIPILVLIAFSSAVVQAQTSDYILNEESSMTIEGTFTIHDWKADVREMDLTVSMNPSLLKGEYPQNPFSSLTLKVPVKSIDSGKRGMDKKVKKLKEQKAKEESGAFYNQAFEWRFEFPEVLDIEGRFIGFDVVIGNPPYGAKIEKGEFEYFKQKFITAKYQVDTYPIFY